MKKYFVYFSFTGNGDFLASLLKEKGYEPVKLELVKPVKKIGFFTILKYGGRAMSHKKEKLLPINLELKEDDEVIIGSPIWNDRLSTPITTFTKKSLKQIEKMGFKKEVKVISYPLKKQEQAKQILGL